MMARLLHRQLAGCPLLSPASLLPQHALAHVEIVPAFLQLQLDFDHSQGHGFVQYGQQCFICIDHYCSGLRGAWELQ